MAGVQDHAQSERRLLSTEGRLRFFPDGELVRSLNAKFREKAYFHNTTSKPVSFTW